MRRASANLCSLGRMSEVWSGVEQAAFMRSLVARLTTCSDTAERDQAFEDFVAKMRAIAEHLLLRQARLRSVVCIGAWHSAKRANCPFSL